MQSMRKSAALLSLGVLLTALLMGCGGDNPAEETAGGTTLAESGDSPDPADSSNEEVATQAECDLPEDLLGRFVIQRQLVLNVASAKGANLEAIQSGNPLDPEVFRAIADALDSLDLSGIPAMQFGPAEDVIADLRRTADLLQAALDAGTDTADPAWQELNEFYTGEFFARHSTSVDYYLTEANCN